MNKRLLFILSGVIVAIVVATGAFVWMTSIHGTASATATAEHHGMSPAIWVAIFTPLWIIIMTNAAKRRRDRQVGGKGGTEDQS